MPLTHESMDLCIHNCLTCYRECEKAARLALGREGDPNTASHVTILRDCAEACKLSADFMLRGSPRHPQACALCAELCDLCADECDRYGREACADACRRCAGTCHSMALAP
jgi:hypothetical protein